MLGSKVLKGCCLYASRVRDLGICGYLHHSTLFHFWENFT